MTSLITSYEDYVRNNPAPVKRMEELARMITMLLPTSKLGDHSELFTEGSYSALGLIGIYHDYVISNGENSKQEPKDIHSLKVVLTLLANTEVVLEMCAKNFGSEKKRWQIIYLIECIKIVARLILLSKSKSGELLHNGGQIEVVKPSLADRAQVTEANQDNAKSSETESTRTWSGRRTGKSVVVPSTISRGTYENLEIGKAAIIRAKTSRDDADELLRKMGELLFILRPLIYLAIMRRSNKNSWRAWLASLFIDILANRCTSVAASPRDLPSDGQPKSSVISAAVAKLIKGADPSRVIQPKSADEIRRRNMLFAYYLMRSPFFDNYTYKFFTSMCEGIENIPLVGGVGGLILESLHYYHRNHFYVSASN